MASSPLIYSSFWPVSTPTSTSSSAILKKGKGMRIIPQCPCRRSERIGIRASSSSLETSSSDFHKPTTQSFHPGGMQTCQGAVAAFLVVAHFIFPLPLNCYWDSSLCPAANAVLYSPDTKVPRTGELALRRAIPANPNMKAIQDSLEDISYLLRIPQRKPYGAMESDVKKALKIAIEEKQSILGGIPEEFKEKGSLLYGSLIDGKGGLQNLIQFIKLNDPDKVSVALASSLDTLAEMELLQAPGLSFLLPEQFLNYPRLTGRGTVEFTIEKGDGATFSPAAGGQPTSLATIQVILDGYSAPLTAGNFAKLVLDGAYDGVTLRCTDQAVLVDSKPETSGYSVPLEVMPSGQFEPLYKTTLSIQDGELPVLPLSVYGSVAMSHGTDSEELVWEGYRSKKVNFRFSDIQPLVEKYSHRSNLEMLLDLQS